MFPPLARSRSAALLVGALILSITLSAHGQNIALSWSGAGADSNWTTVGNWTFTSNGMPAGAYPNNGQPSAGNTYDVTASSGAPMLNTNITINNFTLNGANIGGGSNLAINKLLTWGSGTLGGSGTVTLNGGGSFLGSEFLGQSLVNVNGSTVNVSNGGSLYSNTGGSWNNQSGSAFNFISDASMFNNTATGAFMNAAGAIFAKTAGTGSSTVDWTFTNNGTVNATSGILSFGGINTQNGSITVGTGATVQFASGGASTWTGTAGSSGAGTVELLGGTVNFNGTNSLASAVKLDGATVDGAGAMTISGLFTWSSGNLGASTSPGAGATTLTGGATLNGTMFLNRAVINASTVSFTVNSSLYSNANATWTNQSGSVFNFTTDGNLFINAGTGTFTNNSGATFEKTGGTGMSSVAWNFSNSGTVNNSSAAILAFTGTNTQNGLITVSPGATVQFSSGGASTWTGTAGSSGAGTVEMLGGTVNFNGTHTLASAVKLDGATVDGAGAMTISGPFTWSSGNLGASTSPGAGTTTLSGGGTFNGTMFLNRSVTNAGGSIVNVTTNSSLYSNPNATWTNQLGSVFNFATDGNLFINAGTGTFTNNSGATFEKTGGTGTSSVAWNFSNSGTVNNSSAAILAFTGMNTQNGSITVGAGATVQFSSGGASTWTGTAGSSGAGTVELLGGTVNFNGTHTLASAVTLDGATVDGAGAMTIGGPFTWSSGNLGASTSPGAGTTTLTGGATFNGTMFLNRAVTNASTVTFTTNSSLYSNPNATWTNLSGSVFDFTNDGNLFVNSGSAVTFTNNSGATFEKTGGTGASTINWNFTNNGAVVAGSGTLSFGSGALTNYSSGTLTGGASRVLAGGTLDLTTSRPVATIAAGTTVELNGVGSAFPELENFVTTVAGNLNIFGGRNFTPIGTLADTGVITVGQTAGDGSQFTGAVTVNSGGVLRGTGAVTGVVTVTTGGTVSANGSNFTIGSLTGTAGTVNDNATAPGSLTVGTDNTSTSFSGTVVNGSTGALSLVKVGTGTLTLGNTGNTYSGGTSFLAGTVQIPADGALGTGPLTFGATGTLAYSATTATSKSFALNGGTLVANSGVVVTLNGATVTNGFVDGAGTFATNATNGAQLANVTIEPSVTVTSNSAKDQFSHVSSSAVFNVAAGINTGGTSSIVNLNGFTNQGLGTVTIGAGSEINVAGFQSYGNMTITPATGSQTTLVTNMGSSLLSFNAGSQTFLGTPPTAPGPTGPYLDGIDLHGHNLVLTGGLFVNNGFTVDSTGSSSIIVGYGALYKGAGTNFVPIVTQNGGKFSAGNSPGLSLNGSLVIGPGGTQTFDWQINDAGPSITHPTAPGVAGPSGDSNGNVSGWSLIASEKITSPVPPHNVSSGNMNWTATATPGNQFDFQLETLLGPTTPVGTTTDGAMSDFDMTKSFVWPFVAWQGTYTGPTDTPTLTADTLIDTSAFANAVAPGSTFLVEFNGTPTVINGTTFAGSLNLVYQVPEPGTMALVGLAALAGLRRASRRRQKAASSS